MQTLITSAQNQYVKLYRSLEKRKMRNELNLMPLEGARLVADALSRGQRPDILLVREGLGFESFPFLEQLQADTLIMRVEEKLFARTAFTESPQGILAIVKKPANSLSDVFHASSSLILVVDAVQDPGNLGTMLRSAAAAGAGGAVLLPGTVDCANPKTLRAAMGANFAIPVVEAGHDELISALRTQAIPLITAGARSSVAYDQYDWTEPAAVVIGNEGAGVSPVVAAAATAEVSIPMAAGIESLNAAVAMSVLFFEASRQRRMGQ